MRVKHKKRHKKSKLDPYYDFIKEMLESGMSYNQIADELYFQYDVECVAGTVGIFARNRGLPNIVTRGKNNGRVNIPTCTGCKCLIEASNTMRNGTVLVCTKIPAVISRSCTTSPMDCPFREKGAVNEIKKA